MGEQHRFVAVTRDFHTGIRWLESCHTMTSKKRCAELHDLMDEARAARNNDLWLEIGQALVRACDAETMAVSVCEHFVRWSPDSVFLKVAHESPSKHSAYWHSRAQKLAQE